MNATKSIEQIVAELVLKVEEHGRVIAALRAALGGSAVAGAGGDIAPDSDLDGQYGNEKIRMVPRDWKGAPRKGWLMARCEPEFLDLYAVAMMHFAAKNEASGETKKARYDRLAAARARGWAKRLREGWVPQTSFGSGEAPSDRGENGRGSSWGGGGGAGWGSQEAPPAPANTPDPYAPRGDDDGFANDDEIPF